MKHGILTRVLLGPTVLVALLAACTANEYSVVGHDEMAKNAAEAEAAEEALAKETALAKVPEKSEAKKSSARKPASVRGGVYVVQIGAFKVKENAEKLHEKLKSSGFPVEMRTIEHSKNGTLHLVRMGPVQNKAEAESRAHELKSKFAELEAQIVRLPASL